jgi:hypothetical protein
MANNASSNRKNSVPFPTERIWAEFVPFPSGESWDVDMTKDEFKRLRWEHKQKRSLVALLRKVWLLLQWSKDEAELRKEHVAPLTRPKLRRWSDPSRGLWSWEDVLLDKPTHKKNADAIKVFSQAVKDIGRLQKTKKLPQGQQIIDQNDLIERLELQIIELMEEIRTLNNKLYSPVAGQRR